MREILFNIAGSGDNEWDDRVTETDGARGWLKCSSPGGSAGRSLPGGIALPSRRTEFSVARVRRLGAALLGSLALLRDQVSMSQRLCLACRVDEILTTLWQDTSAIAGVRDQGTMARFKRRQRAASFPRGNRVEQPKTPKFHLPAAFCAASSATHAATPADITCEPTDPYSTATV